MAEGAALTYFLDIKARLGENAFTQVETAAQAAIKNLSATLPPIKVKMALDSGSLAAIRQQIGGLGGVSASEAAFRGNRPINVEESRSRHRERMARAARGELTPQHMRQIAGDYGAGATAFQAGAGREVQYDLDRHRQLQARFEQQRKHGDRAINPEYEHNIRQSAKAYADHNKEILAGAAAAKKAAQNLTPFQHMMEMIGKGQWRRGGAVGATEALGDGPGAQFLGGISGGVLSSLFLPIGWMVGSAIINALGEAGKLPREVSAAGGELAIEALRLRDNRPDLTKEEASRLTTGGEAVVYRNLHDLGFKIGEVQSEYGKMVGVTGDPVESVARTMELAAIATKSTAGEGDDARSAATKRLMSSYTDLKRPGGGFDTKKFIESNPEIYEAVYHQWRKDFGIGLSDKEAGAPFERFLGSHRMSTEVIDKLLKQEGQKDWKYVETLQKERMGNAVYEETGGKLYRENPEEQEELLHRAGIADPKRHSPPTLIGLPEGPTLLSHYGNQYYEPNSVPGIAGEAPKIGREDYRVNTGEKMAQWTSFSGLAEQMQMMWGGAPVDAMQESSKSLASIDQKMDTLIAVSGGGLGQGENLWPGIIGEGPGQLNA